jgi:SHS2 domain-containing protein
MTHLDAEMTCGTATSIARFIKAVTYHDLAIVPVGGGLQTAIVFDV